MIVSESELRNALEPLLDRLLAERLRLFELQMEARLRRLLGEKADAGTNSLAHAEQLLRTTDANETFQALFEIGGELVGAARALLVIRGGEAVVWKSAGVEIPGKFRCSEAERILTSRAGRVSGRHRIAVRGTEIGILFWEAPARPEAHALAQLETLLQMAGLALLGQCFPAPAARAVAVASAGVPTKTQQPRADADGAEARFARLLNDDLALYLRRERADEVEAAVRAGDAAERFAPEWERCRAAFLARYPACGELMGELEL